MGRLGTYNTKDHGPFLASIGRLMAKAFLSVPRRPEAGLTLCSSICKAMSTHSGRPRILIPGEYLLPTVADDESSHPEFCSEVADGVTCLVSQVCVFSESRMREICMSGSTSGNRKQSQVKPDCGGCSESSAQQPPGD